eukprot:TRINITY_DN53122_c0_g1_i1.p1 TRINITY_DN53122_c0_g1~~TRINITY_DN53122_c0_g1_i1.p1  ORF type:complete len:425 (-),score=53.70 TRINITY_DN53122_c0_g1_i1:374-1648(-)
MYGSMGWFAKLPVLLLLLARFSLASDSCCLKAAAIAAGEQPVEWELDFGVEKPGAWDDEDDGPWERPMKRKTPPGPLEIFKKEFVSSIAGACPWLLLGVLFTGLMHGLRPSEETIRFVLSGEGVAATCKGAAFGLMSPLCSCGVLPLILSLVHAGASPRAVIAFLIAAQSAGIDSLAFTLGVLGSSNAIARLATAGALAVVVGCVLPSTTVAAATIQKKKTEECGAASAADRVRTAIVEGLDSFDEVTPAVAFGFGLAAAVVAFLPAGGLSTAVALGGPVGRGALLLVSLPLQFCEHAAVPLAATLQRTGSSGGLAFSVLTTLPGMNAATFGVIATVAGFAGAMRATVAIWLCGFVGSYVADVFGAEVVPMGESEDLLPLWYQDSSRWVVGALFIVCVIRRIHRLSMGGHQESCCAQGGHCKNE